MYNLKETIRPSADLRNHYNEISTQCRENSAAIISTVNGRADTVTVSYDEYQKMCARMELYEMLLMSQDDISNGRVSDAWEMFDKLENKYGEASDEV